MTPHYPWAANAMLVCVTELNTRAQIEALAAALPVPVAAPVGA